MIEKKTILAIDDEKINIEILLELLNNKHDLIPALSADRALEVLKKVDIDLILLDIIMPNMDGYQLCKKLKENEITKNIPIIFITSNTDEYSIKKAYETGGVDYVTKPFKPAELLARINTHVKMRELINDLEKSKEELKLLASTDPMTKLSNRRYFSEISEHIMNLVKRDTMKASIIILDIDRFKNINDTYGHKVGDEVIIDLSNTLQELTRKSDIVCRYGGEEFVILLLDTSLKGTVIIAKKIREYIESNNLYIHNNQKLKYTVSLGVSQVEIEDKNMEAALKRADNALYTSKKNGRNRVSESVKLTV
jgi:diguanylate cyclase (GGDEF)-like protein